MACAMAWVDPLRDILLGERQEEPSLILPSPLYSGERGHLLPSPLYSGERGLDPQCVRSLPLSPNPSPPNTGARGEGRLAV